MKIKAETGFGSGLDYRGPFVYRVDEDGSMTFESAAVSEGRQTAEGAVLCVTDNLGSVRAAINGSTGEFCEVSDYSAFGEAEPLWMSATPADMSLRYHFSGKEDQMTDFFVPQTDFGARHLSPALRSWMVPDPMSEKYYGISPYSYCGGNPVMFVDPDGEIGILVRTVLGAIVGAVVDGTIALMEGKYGDELLGAIAGGAVDGAITGATLGIGSGANVVARMATSVAVNSSASVLSSVTEQMVSTGEVDASKVAISAGIGAAVGEVSIATDYVAKTMTKKTAQSITQKYSTEAVQEAVDTEVKKEFKATGKTLSGKTTKQEIKNETQQRLSSYVSFEVGVTNAAWQGASHIVDKATDESLKWRFYEHR